jgi:hypothetical protein
MLTFAENARFRRSTSVVTSEVACETVVVPVKGEVGDLDAIFSFNEIGADVWALIEEDCSLGELTTWVFDHYAVSRSKAQKDIREFIVELVQAGLATVEQVPFVGTGAVQRTHARH